MLHFPCASFLTSGLQALVSTVVLKLQFLSDELNADLREASSRALSNLPKYASL